jgi:hypothetical protein
MPRIEAGMRVNHFPGMFDNLGRKSGLARNMARMQRHFPLEFRFTPYTWVLPYEKESLERHHRSGSQDVYIVKPDNACQGKGIFLTNDMQKIRHAMLDNEGITTVVQIYIGRPLLIEGLKFDLRLYLLVCGFVTPKGLQIRSFLFKDGLVRLCTVPYEAPTTETLDEKYMHLTNYSINKYNSDFRRNMESADGTSGNKRSLHWFFSYYAEQFGDQEREKLWGQLVGICTKMIATVEPALVSEYTATFPKYLQEESAECRCFQLLGVDVMLDEKRKPYLIEVNTLPSFDTSSPLDQDIKGRAVQQAFDLACEGLQASTAACELGEATATPSLLPSLYSSQSSAEALLDVEVHGEFERVFPPRIPKLIEQCEMILAHARDSFRSLYSTLRPQRSLQASISKVDLKGQSSKHKDASHSAAGKRHGSRRKTMPGPPRCASVGLPALSSSLSSSSLRLHAGSRSQSGPLPIPTWSTKPREIRSQVHDLTVALDDQRKG